MKTIRQLRKALKALGFKFTVNKMACAATYIHIESKEKCVYYTPATDTKWETLFKFLREYKNEVQQIGKDEGVYGLCY